MEHTEKGLPEPGPLYLEATEYFDFGVPAMKQFVDEAIGDAATATDKAVRLYYAVRDRVRYDPYCMSGDPATYKASYVLETRAGYCIQKAILLAACTRAVGIPTGLGLSNVTNHLCTERLLDLMGGKTLFVNHGYAVMFLESGWVKAAPAFNIELCEKFHVLPTEFDGSENALFQEFDKHGRLHMEYEADHGIWSDYPHDRVMSDFEDYYPKGMYAECAKHRAGMAARAAARFEDEQPIS